jgi:hypothetical protein
MEFKDLVNAAGGANPMTGIILVAIALAVATCMIGFAITARASS